MAPQALEPAAIQELIKKLDQDRNIYLNTLSQFHEQLTQALSAQNPAPILSSPGATSQNSPVVQSPRLRSHLPSITNGSIAPSSFLELSTTNKPVSLAFSAESTSDSDNGESLFVSEPLAKEFHSQESLKNHIKEYRWTVHGQCVLDDILQNQRHLDDRKLFQQTSENDINSTDYAPASIYNVMEDGSALPAFQLEDRPSEKDIWDALQSVNHGEGRKQAVGRITTLREPSPLLLAAVHKTMNHHFDIDFLFRLLTDDSPTKVFMKGCMKQDPRHQRTFFFTFKYHTIVGPNKAPLEWQPSDDDLSQTKDHIPISTCASVVALCLSGTPSHTLRRQSRKSRTVLGHVHDPFSPWQVLHIQCYPDWHSTTDVHNTNHHYVNGPEAFLITILHEYRDAVKRFKALSRAIVKLVTPSKNFLFSPALRDELLFESRNYTYSRRYFWAFQTFAMFNDEIEAMTSQYQDTFTEAVWSGEHPFIWPGTKDKSARYQNWRKKKMMSLKRQFEKEIASLEAVLASNKREQDDINHMREQLFSGTSVQESRQAVELAKFTFQQGQNIRLLTLVSIFFLPLTFVTSVFGMTNMPQNDNFVRFGIVVATVCVPCYVLIGLVEGRSFERLAVFWQWLKVNQGWVGAKSKQHDTEKGGDASRIRRPARNLMLFEAESTEKNESPPTYSRHNRVQDHPLKSAPNGTTTGFQPPTTAGRRPRRADTSNTFASSKYELDPLEKADTPSGMSVTKTNTLPLITEKDHHDEDDGLRSGTVVTGVKRSRTFDLFSGTKRDSHDGGRADEKMNGVGVGIQRRGTMTDG